MTKVQENVTYSNTLRLAQTQGRHRVFQSGPSEETIECLRHQRVGSMRGVSFHPIVRGSPPIFRFNFERFYVRFNRFDAFGLDCSRFAFMFWGFFARKDTPCGVENRMLDKNFYRQLRFSLFSSACYFDICIRMLLSKYFKHH